MTSGKDMRPWRRERNWREMSTQFRSAEEELQRCRLAPAAGHVSFHSFPPKANMRPILCHLVATALVTTAAAVPLAAQRPNRAIDRANLDTTCAACTDFYT